VADNYPSEIQVGQPIVPPRKSYSGAVIGFVAFVLIVAAAGVLWVNTESLTDLTHRWLSPSTAATDDTSELAKELQAFQQQTTEALGATRQLLEAQQSDLKALTSQIADLTAKLDRSQPGAAPPQLPIPPQAASQAQPAPQRVAPAVAPPARAVVTAPRKRPAIPRSEGAISVGGAPLPGAGTPVR
jgi:uncharacterized coiled-coil protein SlyX